MTEMWIIGLAAAVGLAAIVVAFLVGRRTRSQGDLTGEVKETVARLEGLIDGRMTAMAESHDVVRRAVEGLFHNAGKRGKWGELTLRNLLEANGLVRNKDFEEQVDLGGGGIPDVVVRLGDAGKVIIDAKAPMDWLGRGLDAETETDRVNAFKEHAKALRTYAQDLRKRDYPAQVGVAFAPVVMYVPVEGAWQCAEEARPDLLEEILRLGVYPASPVTIGLVIELLHHQALSLDRDQVAVEVVDEACTMLSRIGTHAEKLAKLGRGIETITKTYNEAVGNLERSVLPSVRRVATKVPGARPPAELEPVERVPQTERAEGMTEANAA